MKNLFYTPNPTVVSYDLPPPFLGIFSELVDRYIANPLIQTEARPSTMGGMGLFATANIAPLTIVGVFKNAHFVSNELYAASPPEYQSRVKNYALSYCGGALTPNSLTELEGQDNAYFANSGFPVSATIAWGGMALLFSLVSLPKGSEITYDYGPNHFLSQNPNQISLGEDPLYLESIIRKLLQRGHANYVESINARLALLKQNLLTLSLDEALEFSCLISETAYLNYLIGANPIIPTPHPLYRFLCDRFRNSKPEFFSTLTQDFITFQRALFLSI